MSTKKSATKDLEALITDLGEITLDKVYDLTDKKNARIRQLNIPNLTDTLIKSVLQLNGKDPAGNNIDYDVGEKSRIREFVSHFRQTAGHFMDFLDYDNDNQVNLVTLEKTKGKVEVGKDLESFLDDMKDIGSPFKSDSTGTDKVVATLTNVFVYLTSDEFTETKEDVIAFNKSVKKTYTALKALKNIQHKKVLVSRVDDMVSFVIMFCVLLVPIIKLVNAKLTELNAGDVKAAAKASSRRPRSTKKGKSKRGRKARKAVPETTESTENAEAAENAGESDDGSDSVSAELAESVRSEPDDIITNEEIEQVITDMYGTQLEMILKLVEQITKRMTEYVESSKFEKLKNKLCCCCAAEEDDKGKK